MNSLERKVAVVTGAGRGVGKGIATELATRGAIVAVSSLHVNNAKKVCDEIARSGGKAIALGCDVNDKEAIGSMIGRVMEECGAVDILVNNAQGSMGTGQTAGKPIEDLTDEDMYANFRGGVLASLWAMQAVLPSMRERGGGRIINLSSMNGQLGLNYTAHYNAAKEGIRALTRTAAREWAHLGITVNAISPIILSDSWSDALKTNPELLSFIESGTPLRRVGLPEGAGRVIAFLASDDAKYITGMTFMVDGGRIMGADARTLRYPGEPAEMVGATGNLDRMMWGATQ